MKKLFPLLLLLLACEDSALGGFGGVQLPEQGSPSTDQGISEVGLSPDFSLPGLDGTTLDSAQRDEGPALGDGDLLGEMGSDLGCEPVPERCNGRDDDCDGEIDEEIAPQACVAGPCELGETRCIEGGLRCEGSGNPPLEICNGEDDDCDGEIDEDPSDVGGICGSDEGRCQAGTLICREGRRWCEGSIGARDESCNGLDDDCDGETDEDLEEAGVECNAGNCGLGSRQCLEGAWACVGEAEHQELEICDGLDNDCDGLIDEEDPQLGERCGLDEGTCQQGEISCVAGLLACLDSVAPVDEICNGLDDDCDGVVDEEDAINAGAPCPALGERCRVDLNCVDGLCLDDYGQRYCSLPCDLDLGLCPQGMLCELRGPRTVCVHDYPSCRSNGDCTEGDQCSLHPPSGPDELGAECRPLLEGGELGALCDDERPCASGMCMARTGRCSALCDADCGDFACILTPFNQGDGTLVDLGLCFSACTGDRHCPEGLLCQYSWRSDREEILGYCDGSFGETPVGDPCTESCDHNSCHLEGGYCTQGCVTLEDCPAGWRCELTPVGESQRGICSRP